MEQNIQDSIEEGKDISGVLVDALKRTSLADQDRPNLQRILGLAEELRRYQSPVEFTIGLIGDSGVGKSSLINCLLETKNLAKTGSTGHACTAAVTEYRSKREADTTDYTFEVECMGKPEMEDLLRQSVLDYRRFHLMDLVDDERPGSSEIARLKERANTAWGILSGAFEDLPECQQSFFRSRERTTDSLVTTVLAWRERRLWPRGFDENTIVHTADNEEDCVRWRDAFLVNWIWPFIKVIRVYFKASVLQNGIVLVDLPGFRDVNTARMRVAEMRLKHCDEIFVVAELERAITNQGVEEIMLRQLGKNFNSLQRKQGVAVICTKSEVDWDDLTKTGNILRDIPHTDELINNINTLREKIREAEDDELLTASNRLKAELSHQFISLRNEYVMNSFKRRYEPHHVHRKITVYCVSNTLHRKGVELKEGIEGKRRGNQRVSNVDERIFTANQKLESSGIPIVHDFISSIPYSSHREETRRYLNIQLLTLVQQIGLWLNARVSGKAAVQPEDPGLLNELQTELQTIFDNSVTVSHDQLTLAKNQLLRRPLTQGTNRWEIKALSEVQRFERQWHSATVLAFWNNDGAHSTRKQEYTDWNAEIIKAMVEDVQPSEELFQVESERVLTTFKQSTHAALTAMPLRLGELQGVEDLLLTFPRRHQNLDYEIDNITTWFLEEVQTTFHDLFKTHSSSFVMHRMQTMYNEIDSGQGVTQRRFRRLRKQISGDPRLFTVIRNLFLAALGALLANAKDKLQQAVNDCSSEIQNDLELVRGEEVPAVQENNLRELCAIWEEASARRERASEALEAVIRSRAGT